MLSEELNYVQLNAGQPVLHVRDYHRDQHRRRIEDRRRRDRLYLNLNRRS